MDPKLLPIRAMVDTGVFIRALGQRPDDPRSPDCRDFLDAMYSNQREVLLAAPSLAETIRGFDPPSVPSTAGIEVVAFDDEAAIALGLHFPNSTLKHLALANDVSLTKSAKKP